MDLNSIVDGAIRALPLPNVVENSVIAIKDVIKESDIVKGFLKSFSDKDLINDLWSVRKNIKKDGLIGGVSKIVDLAIKNAKNDNVISGDIAKILNNCKSVIVKDICDKQSKTAFIGQEKVLEKVSEKYNLFEESLNKGDLKEINRLKDEVINEYKRLTPTKELICKVEEIENKVELMNSKKAMNLSELENSILNKIA